MDKVLVTTVETVRAWEIMYKAVVKTVLIYRRDSWTVMDAMLNVL